MDAPVSMKTSAKKTQKNDQVKPADVKNDQTFNPLTIASFTKQSPINCFY